MGWFSKLVGAPDASNVVSATGNALDSLFTSDEEKAQAAAVMEKIKQNPQMWQAQINMISAGHRSVFVAGWRPALGWVAAISLGFFYIPQYALASYLWIRTILATGELVAFPVNADGLLELVFAMLGLATLRTAEKFKGAAK